MSIVNRTLDPSEQQVALTHVQGAAVTGATYLIGVIQSPCVPTKMVFGALGLSGAPTWRVNVLRQVSAGMTTLTTLMGLQAPTNLAATLPLSVTFAPTFTFLAKDVLVLETSVANTAVEKVLVDLVVRKTQDIVSFY